MKKLILFLSIFLALFSKAQTSLFQDGDRVCFVGNSITSNGEFYHNIYQYYVTRFPKNHIEFLNCGISGDVTSGILKRLDFDILSHNPTHAVIMIGMNDVNRSLYGANISTNTDTINKRELAINSYKKNAEQIVKKLLDLGVIVILQKPSIYDQTVILPKENNLGVNDSLKVCADLFSESNWN